MFMVRSDRLILDTRKNMKKLVLTLFTIGLTLSASAVHAQVAPLTQEQREQLTYQYIGEQDPAKRQLIMRTLLQDSRDQYYPNDSLSDTEVSYGVIRRESSYFSTPSSGKCDSPSDLDSLGHRCGDRSSWSRQGGRLGRPPRR